MDRGTQSKNLLKSNMLKNEWRTNGALMAHLASANGALTAHLAINNGV
jgi:hypothetical protein